ANSADAANPASPMNPTDSESASEAPVPESEDSSAGQGSPEDPLPGVDEGPAPAPSPRSDESALGLRPRLPTQGAKSGPSDDASSPATPPSPKVTAAELPPLRVAIGYSVEAPGTRDEELLLDRLEAGMAATVRPELSYRRLRPGSAGARELCAEGRDDLVIAIGYLPDREAPLLLPYDCAIDEGLGVRDGEA